jgi:hypothetical protein
MLAVNLQGMLLGHRQHSDRSITETMLDDHVWTLDSTDLLDGFDPLPGGIAGTTIAANTYTASGAAPRLTQQALRQHQATVGPTNAVDGVAGADQAGQRNRSTTATNNGGRGTRGAQATNKVTHSATLSELTHHVIASPR